MSWSRIGFVAAAAGLLAAPATTQPATPSRDEQRLAQRLQGQAPFGAPQDCIDPARTDSAGGNYGDRVAVRGRNGNLYISQLDRGCRVRETDALISLRPHTRICRGEIFQARDLLSGITTGCAFGSFQEYRRVK